jgi:citrate lyase gamma subunit
MKFIETVKSEIRNDLGARIAGCVLMTASVVSVFVASLDVDWKGALLPFIVGLYLAFRKTGKNEK